jgi:gliding motility-associated-like protein
LSDASIADPFLYVNESTVRRIIVTNNYACKDTNAVTIELIPFEPKADRDKHLCIRDSLRLNASGGDTYRWLSSADISDTLTATPNIWPREDVSYVVLVQDTVCNRKATLVIDIDVHALPDIKIVLAKDIDCGLTAGKLAVVGGEKYTWLPTEGLDNPNAAQPVAMPAQNTRYVVTGIDHNGCVNKDSADIQVFAGDGRLFTPNAFTPNNDGKNDCFHVIIPGDMNSFELSVYDRYGQMVFHSNSYSSCWDGRYHGIDQPLGTYFYFYKANSTVCNDVFGKGDVQLVR